MKNFMIAHSPDADDIFMYYAIKFGWITESLTGKPSKKYKFQNIAEDIETLNQKALKNIYDVSAISFGVYPFIKDEYALLRTAISFGYGYGPKLVKLKGEKLKPNFKVALSGEYTTNALIFKIAYPKARIIYKNFLDIEKAVLDGEVDAGVLIHESILTFNERLEVEKELWDLWVDMAGETPLPLGGMAIRRSVPLIDAINIENILTRAVEVANRHKNLLAKMLIERNLVRVDDKTLDKYLSLYANDKSVELDEEQLNAINKLYEIGHKAKLLPKIKDIREYLIPKEYKNIRFEEE
ncbi:succinate--CoA ligase [Nautilia sp. PV-1]|uniref:menaquinone biosynthesis family protein n=1 Tax=Nautilia sp. PV-1 TaxID=2579250 RepID=UPI000FD8E58A|nr:MqnA/MqnD/SBP family protein [Nautilia sp. PV-1]AZV45973.1 succinate--CoA ligase [Nautilia sp. PV-1]